LAVVRAVALNTAAAVERVDFANKTAEVLQQVVTQSLLAQVALVDQAQRVMVDQALTQLLAQ
jgi:hypothetical protein